MLLFFFVNQVMMTIKVDIAILQSGSGIEFEIFDKIEEKKMLRWKKNDDTYRPIAHHNVEWWTMIPLMVSCYFHFFYMNLLM